LRQRDERERLVAFAVRELADMGYENVRDYEGGKEDWVEAGLLTEGESHQ
jgi:rhodanese-related sulfurtransferase